MKKVITIFLVLLPFLTHAQLEGLHKIDSLKKQLVLAGEDTNKVNILWDLSSTYYYINPDTGLRYGEEGLKTATGINWKEGIGLTHFCVGESYLLKAQYHEALNHFFHALKIFEELKKEKKWQARTLEAIGSVYMQMSMLPKALEYQNAALKISEEINVEEDIAGNLSNIGNIYSLQNNYAKALEYYFRSQKLFQKLGKNDGIANCLVNIGYAYQGQGNNAKAIEQYFAALRLFEELKHPNGIAATMGNIGETYLALATDTATGSNILLANKKNNIDKAILYLNKAIALSKENNILDYIIEFSKYLSNAYELNGNYKEALENYKQYATIHDSVFNSSSNEKIAKLEQEGLKERARAALAQKQTEQKLYITGITFLIVVIVYVGRKFVKQLRSNKILSKEAKKALARIEAQSNVLINISHTQAHEVRGPITTILGLVSIFNHDDPADPMNKQLLDDITEVTLRLDKTVKGIIQQENNLSHETDI